MATPSSTPSAATKWWRLRCLSERQAFTLEHRYGRPYALMPAAGNVSDIEAAPALLERAGPTRYLLDDKGYDADELRRPAHEESRRHARHTGPP